MTERSRPGYVVLRRVGADRWQLVGEADRRPGLTAKASRLQAIQDVAGGNAKASDEYKVLPRSEWDLAGR
jgi:hypothetical protein